MSSPQLENGYTKIADEILEALAQIPLSGYEFRVVNFIIRKTYGWGKKEDWITNTQLTISTGICKTHISRTIKGLIAKKIVTKNGNKLGLQKKYILWKVTKNGNNSYQKWLKKLPKMVPTIENIQQTDDFKKKSHSLKEKNNHERNNITKDNMFNYNENKHQEDVPTVDMETGEIEQKEKKKGKNKIAFEIVSKFEKKVKKVFGSNVKFGKKEYTLVCNALGKHQMTEEQILEMCKDWFASGRADNEMIHLSRCFSDNRINTYKNEKRI